VVKETIVFRRDFLGFLSSIPFLGWLSPKSEPEIKNNSLVIARNGVLAIITDDPVLLACGGTVDYAVIPRSTYEFVKKWVDARGDEAARLMAETDKHGDPLFWAENYHDKWCDEICGRLDASNAERCFHTHNALWACGY
jgi:hypothetical protein